MNFHLIGSQRRQQDSLRAGKTPGAGSDWDILLEVPEINWEQFRDIADAEYPVRQLNASDKAVARFLWEELARIVGLEWRHSAPFTGTALQLMGLSFQVHYVLVQRAREKFAIPAEADRVDIFVYLPPTSGYAEMRYGILMTEYNPTQGHGGHLTRGPLAAPELPDFYDELVKMTGLP